MDSTIYTEGPQVKHKPNAKIPQSVTLFTVPRAWYLSSGLSKQCIYELKSEPGYDYLCSLISKGQHMNHPKDRVFVVLVV
jgi:hypothetical protein